MRRHAGRGTARTLSERFVQLLAGMIGALAVRYN